MEPNHLKLVDGFGRKPTWMDYTNCHAILIAPDKSQINVNILIESDLFGTRIIKLDISRTERFPNLLDDDDDPETTGVNLPPESIDSGENIDLKRLFPTAIKR